MDEKKSQANDEVMRGLVNLLGVDDEENDPYDDERHDVAGFTKDFLQRTSLHGLQYIGENNRSIFERIFWVASFCLGGFLASYFISALWDKWESSPVYVSVDTTSYPIYNIPFPAVSICSVNKLQEDRLDKAIEKIKEDSDVLDSYSSEEISDILESMIRYEDLDETDPMFQNNINLPPSELLRIFKSAMPSCRDMLMYCEWMHEEIECLRLFKVMTTDDGFCCVFNAIEAKELLHEESAALPENYTFMDDNEYVKVDCVTGATSCVEGWAGGDIDLVEDDDYESTWRQHPPPPPPNRRRRRKRSPSVDDDEVANITGALPVPQVTRGAGAMMGLTVMLFADVDKYYQTSAFFEGFKVLVHHPEDFPYVRDKGFVVPPGSELFTAVNAFDVYSTTAVRDISVEKRHCYFYDEKKLDHYSNYSRSNCLMECSVKVINELCGCQPYYYPIRGNDLNICGVEHLICLKEHSDSLRMLAFPTDDIVKKLQDAGIECSCPGGCDELVYNLEISSAPYPSEMAFKSEAAMKALSSNFKNSADFTKEWFQKQTTLMHIFFKNEFIIQYKRDTLYGVNDFISNMGGLMGLCLGFSLLSAIEVIYWFCVRWGILILKRKKQVSTDESERKDNIDKNIKHTTGKVFDEIFRSKTKK